jgi:hypothetical protein
MNWLRSSFHQIEKYQYRLWSCLNTLQKVEQYEFSVIQRLCLNYIKNSHIKNGAFGLPRKDEVHELSGIFHEKLEIQLAGQEKPRFLRDSIAHYPSSPLEHSNTGTEHRTPSSVWTFAVLLLQNTLSGHKAACLLKVTVKLHMFKNRTMDKAHIVH